MTNDIQNRTARAPSSAHATHESRGARGAGKAGNATAADAGTDAAGGQGGFSLLLASLGAGLDATGAGALPGADNGLGAALAGDAMAGDALASGAAAGNAAGASGLPGMDPLAMALQGLVPGGTAGAWPAAAGSPGGGAGGSLAQALRPAGLMDASSLVGQTALIDGAADLSGAAANAAGKAFAASRGGTARSGHAAMGGTAGSASETAGASAGGLMVPVLGGKDGELPGAHVLAQAVASASSASAGATAQPDRRDAGFTAGLQAAPRGGESSMMAASAVGGALQDLTPQAGGRADAAVSASLGMDRAVVPASPDGSQASGSFAADAAGDGAAGVADPSQIPMEDQIAEQVAYWVHQKTQNAELTIDRDGQPVEVSVSLTGNEAHVAFRSDQSQTRDMLDTSVAQLRELLRGEGLELAGVSIGQSGAGAGGDASGRPSGRGEGGARIGRVQAAGGGAQGAGDIPRPASRPDRALDVFA
ncbi:flagellar hook-length control protein FliK [Paracidovorax citrulli]|uniref:flagellar hook-length control protein FliK n=2 Tax=Paracidovorax citrulli TaxID=80869 RepID=UPI00066217A8|nr:flagellar hook-length control protein FliK [Paracidovorax citrulli]QCX10287.1 hypothetical protein APS58_1396 [Paracidovorax citrulli]UEG46722.1 flagellar hook-length control protein FliK [Paracidovorax citrulli]UMT90023.1 flagellar hook-length control protein FliK [Paracidovorax citrulli]UMT94058.1 flagellar hook-length control protein FliK [Paracidovorax citrulli]WIY35184.1 flagellar hook-length control protein FliK [Paracidovorax citrulli]